MLRNILLQSRSQILGQIYRNVSFLVQSKAYIDGRWVDSSNSQTFPVINPANGNEIGQVPDMDVKDAEDAIDAAKKAFYSNNWSGLTAKERAGFLKKWYTLIEANRNEIARIITAESGKPIREAQGEVTYGNSFLEWFAEEARRIYGDVIPSPTANRETIIIKQPIGVVGIVTPWNFPLAMITRKVGAAFAAGCTVVIKPAEDTPLTALALAKLAEDAGIPNGVLNVVTTKKPVPIGDLFCKSPDIAGISFTGSTNVGKYLYKTSADHVKRVSLELGGNAPFIVFDSANVEKAVDGAIASKFRNCGQTCASANRFFIQAGIYNKFVEHLKSRIASLKMGSGDAEDVQLGPLINKPQFDKVSSFVEDAKSKNATILTGGQPATHLGQLFYQPTIVTDIAPNMKLYNEEVFGPVVSILKFNDENEVIQRANNTRSGLAGYFYSENYQQIFRVARKLEVGMIGINEGLVSAAEAPFGGIKESGIGREGSHYGIDEFVNVKYLCLGNLKF